MTDHRDIRPKAYFQRVYSPLNYGSTIPATGTVKTRHDAGGDQLVAYQGTVMAESFEQFVETHYQPAYRFALSLCCHEADACDLTQQVFYIAQEKLYQVRNESKQKSWLFTVLRREFLRSRRQRAMHAHFPMELVEAEKNISVCR